VATLSSLDESLINRSAPPGSMRYFSLLYTPPEQRDAVTALYVIDAEIRESAQSVNHDVAHTRLQWWRQEIDRLANGNPQHPATRILGSQPAAMRGNFARLHELIAAADMDLARMTYLNMTELRAYGARSGGAIQELIAGVLVSPNALEQPARLAANRIGAGIRQTEMLRDVRQDAHDGRLYVPLDELEKGKVGLDALRAREVSADVKAVLGRFCASIAADLEAAMTSFPPGIRSHLRPLLVMAALHRRLLMRIAGRNYEIASQRIELGPIEKSWVAWRAARRAGS
jgi:phytoene synthase